MTGRPETVAQALVNLHRGGLSPWREAPEPPAWPPSQAGPCAKCREPAHRYGPGGGPLCESCRPQPSVEPDVEAALPPDAAAGPRTITRAPVRAPEPESPQLELFA